MRNLISLAPLVIEPKFDLDFEAFRLHVKQEYETLIAADEEKLEAKEFKLKVSNAVNIESAHYVVVQQQKVYNELLTTWLDAGVEPEWLNRIATQISKQSISYYNEVGEPISLAILNRKFSKSFHTKIKKTKFGEFVIMLCECSYIKFEAFTTKSGSRVLVPSMLRRLEDHNSYPDFKFEKMGQLKEYPKLTPELMLGYL